MATAGLDLDIRRIRMRLEREGWVAREGGDHSVFKPPARPGRVVVPRGRGDLAPGTARNIARDAGWL